VGPPDPCCSRFSFRFSRSSISPFVLWFGPVRLSRPGAPPALFDIPIPYTPHPHMFGMVFSSAFRFGAFRCMAGRPLSFWCHIGTFFLAFGPVPRRFSFTLTNIDPLDSPCGAGAFVFFLWCQSQQPFFSISSRPLKCPLFIGIDHTSPFGRPLTPSPVFTPVAFRLVPLDIPR